MAQIFHRSTNAISRISIFGSVMLVIGALWLLGALNRSPWVTELDVALAQPVQFSHAHHVGGLGIDCRYCHSSVEVAASAGIPSTKVCMTCHSILWDRTEMLEPVRESYRTEQPIAWTRVHDLPDFVYFDHSIHVAKGIGCESCHGRVDRMPLMWRDRSLNMESCLECHRDPAPYVRPREHVFDMGWEPERDRRELGAELAALYDVQPQEHCNACHR